MIEVTIILCDLFEMSCSPYGKDYLTSWSEAFQWGRWKQRQKRNLKVVVHHRSLCLRYEYKLWEDRWELVV